MLEVFAEIGFPRAVKAIADSGGCLDVRLDLICADAVAGRFGERERLATEASPVPSFQPRAVAVVGASRSSGGIDRRLLDNLVGQGLAAGCTPSIRRPPGSATCRPPTRRRARTACGF